MIPTLFANSFNSTKGKIMLYVKNPTLIFMSKNFLFIYCHFSPLFFCCINQYTYTPNVIKISTHVLYNLGKSFYLFWPHMPSINKKLHEHTNFCFGRKGFCCCVIVRVCVCVGFGEKTDKRYNIWMEGFVSPRHQSSAEIKHHHLLQSLLRSGGLDSVQGTLGGHHLEPPCCQTSELRSSGKQIRAGFPTAQLAVGSFSLFFLFPETASAVCPHPLHALYCG